jgi:serine/threonine protein kinase/Tol biopolymer transport system component
MADRDPLSDVADAIADGTPVEWPSAEASVDRDELGTLAELRIIEEIARLHWASAGAPAAESSAQFIAQHLSRPASDAAPPLFEWGPLRVLERVGAGSFGEVFRAWDTALDREVALKLLPAGASRRSRAAASIVREGQMLARVSHPNVMAVYGAQQLDAQVGIWGEFLRGRTLASMVTDDGPLSAQEASTYVDAVCRALTAVHRAGLLHRDVKAQNVMREAGGRVVLMDFGLGREANLPGAPGLELAGTPLYLAPELFRGEPASAQSDIYGVGVLLFYLVTGRYPVEGRSIEEIRAQHQAGRRVRLQDLRSDVPAAFVHVVERALDPDRAARFESAGALQSALAPATHVPQARPPAERWRVRLLAAGLGLALLALAAVPIVNRLRSTPPPIIAFTLAPPDGATFPSGSRNVAVISPDGRYVAFLATTDGVSELWLRDLSDQAPRRLQGTAGAFLPFWSADSQFIWFVADGALQRVSITGARSESIPMSHEHAGAVWNERNVLLIARDAAAGLTATQNGKDTPRQVTKVDKSRGEETHCCPQFLPDGEHFIFYVGGGETVKGTYVGSLDGAAPRRVIVTDASAVYGSGYLLYARDGTLFAQPFDARRAELSGAPLRVRNQIAATWESRLLVSASDNDRLVFATRDATDNRQLTWKSMTGAVAGTAAGPERLANPALSSDGRFIAVQVQADSQRSQIRILDAQRGTWANDLPPLDGENPVWGPNGLLVYSAPREGRLEVATTMPFAGARSTTVVRSDVDQQPKQVTDVSRDGARIAYTAFRSSGASGNYDLWIAGRDGSSPRQIHKTDSHEISGRFSPDGTRLAFVSDFEYRAPATVNGRGPARMQVYVQPLADASAPVRLSAEAGGYDPVWASDTQLLFIDRDGWMNSVSVPRGSAAAARAVRLFQTGIWLPGATRNHYDVARDGSRLILAVPLPSAFSVVSGWPSLLTR